MNNSKLLAILITRYSIASTNTRPKQKFAKVQKPLPERAAHAFNRDYVTHIDYGIGRFAGLGKVEVNGGNKKPSGLFTGMTICYTLASIRCINCQVQR